MDIVRQSLAILFVFALLCLALWLVRKKGWIAMRRSKAVPSLLESRGKLVLTPRHSVHLVRVGDRNVVLALHPDGVTFLGDTVLLAACERKDGACVT
jgi:flagellar biogenesis protein FliO